MLSDHQINSRITSRRALLVAAGVSLLGGAAACRSPWSDGGPSSSGPGAAATDAAGVQAPSSSPAPSSAVPAAAPPVAGTSPVPPSGSASPGGAFGRALTEAESKPVYELGGDRRVVALTIDDGPDPRYTPAVLDLLQQHRIRATFFLIGENAVEHQSLVREIADRGHHVGNHTWTHPDLRHMPEEQVRSELERTCDLLLRITGRQTTWFRAPGGDWSPVALKVSADLGLRNLGWSVDPRDWATPGTSVIIERVLQNVRPGSIVLNHDGGGDRSQTVAALKSYLPVLVDSGYSFTAPPN
jgi:peptidoglycan-N-acetylglucosamine deacetylase